MKIRYHRIEETDLNEHSPFLTEIEGVLHLIWPVSETIRWPIRGHLSPMGYAWTQRMLPQGECRWSLGATYNHHV